MSFQPIVPSGGIAGWKILQQTRARQEEAFTTSPSVTREVDYFKEKIGEIGSAEELVSDFRLMRVALGAFGLDDDINNRFYIQKVLEGGTIDPDSLANRLSDKRYHQMSEAFGFELTPPNTNLSDFADTITSAYTERQFEVAVGRQSEDMRLALGLERDLGALLDKGMTEKGTWYSILGNSPLRSVFDRALGVPSSLAATDLDRQLEFYKERAEAVFGSSDPQQFSDAQKLDGLRTRFLSLGALDVAPAATTRGSAAVALLQATAAQGSSTSNLLGLL